MNMMVQNPTNAMPSASLLDGRDMNKEAREIALPILKKYSKTLAHKIEQLGEDFRFENLTSLEQAKFYAAELNVESGLYSEKAFAKARRELETPAVDETIELLKSTHKSQNTTDELKTIKHEAVQQTMRIIDSLDQDLIQGLDGDTHGQFVYDVHQYLNSGKWNRKSVIGLLEKAVQPPRPEPLILTEEQRVPLSEDEFVLEILNRFAPELAAKASQDDFDIDALDNKDFARLKTAVAFYDSNVDVNAITGNDWSEEFNAQMVISISESNDTVGHPLQPDVVAKILNHFVPGTNLAKAIQQDDFNPDALNPNEQAILDAALYLHDKHIDDVTITNDDWDNTVIRYRQELELQSPVSIPVTTELMNSGSAQPNWFKRNASRVVAVAAAAAVAVIALLPTNISTTPSAPIVDAGNLTLVDSFALAGNVDFASSFAPMSQISAAPEIIMPATMAEANASIMPTINGDSTYYVYDYTHDLATLRAERDAGVQSAAPSDDTIQMGVPSTVTPTTTDEFTGASYVEIEMISSPVPDYVFGQETPALNVSMGTNGASIPVNADSAFTGIPNMITQFYADNGHVMNPNVEWQVGQIEQAIADGNELMAQEHAYHAIYDIKNLNGSADVVTAVLNAIDAEDQGTRFERESQAARINWALRP